MAFLTIRFDCLVKNTNVSASDRAARRKIMTASCLNSDTDYWRDCVNVGQEGTHLKGRGEDCGKNKEDKF